MKAELYLKQINQEMIDAGRVARPMRGADWTVSWPKECCILDFGLIDRDMGDPEKRGYLLRQEKDGGMFWDPRTGSVYKVDEEGYHAMLEFDHGLTEKEVARRMEVPIAKVKTFVKQLNGFLK